MPEWGPLGSVRGALSNERPYRDLRNVAINYPLVRAHRFAGIQPNSGRRDYSRLSCAAGEMPLGPRAAGIFSKRCAPKWPSSGHCTFRLFCLALDLTFYVAGSSSESLFHPAANVFGITDNAIFVHERGPSESHDFNGWEWKPVPFPHANQTDNINGL